MATGIAIAFGLTERTALLVPDYVASVQRAVEDNASAQEVLADVAGTSEGDEARGTGGRVRRARTYPDALGPVMSFNECEADPSTLGNCGPARDFVGILQWLNTEAPLRVTDLRGSVVLVDFWTFGCINCQRTQPYLNDWDATYGDQGLRIIGIHCARVRPRARRRQRA